MRQHVHICVIGAGLSGLACAQTLRHDGSRLTVIEKSGDIGGRLATRRKPDGHWNHGAPAVHAGGADFKAFLASAPTARAAPERVIADSSLAFVGVPDMRELVRPMQDGLNVVFRTEAQALRPDGDQWRVRTPNGELGPFDAVLMTQPAPQVRQLLERSNQPYPAALDLVQMTPCWTLLLAFQEASVSMSSFQPSAPIASVHQNPTVRRRSQDLWVLHATESWSRQHLSCSKDEVQQLLLRELDRQLRHHFPDQLVSVPASSVAHRWRYARTKISLGRTHLWLPDVRLGMAGDWCMGTTAECAYLSGTALAKVVSVALSDDHIRSGVAHA